MTTGTVKLIGQRLLWAGLVLLVCGVIAGYLVGAHLLPAHNTYIPDSESSSTCAREDVRGIGCGWTRVYDLAVFEPNGGSPYLNPLAALIVGVPIGAAGVLLSLMGAILVSSSERQDTPLVAAGPEIE